MTMRRALIALSALSLLAAGPGPAGAVVPDHAVLPPVDAPDLRPLAYPLPDLGGINLAGFED